MEGPLHRTELTFSFFTVCSIFFFPADLKAIPEAQQKKSGVTKFLLSVWSSHKVFHVLGTVCSLTGPYSTPTPLLSQPQPPKLCTSFKAALQKSVSKAMTWRTPQNILRAEAHGGWYFFCYMSQLTATPLGYGINLTALCLALSANRSLTTGISDQPPGQLLWYVKMGKSIRIFPRDSSTASPREEPGSLPQSSQAPFEGGSLLCFYKYSIFLWIQTSTLYLSWAAQNWPLQQKWTQQENLE